MTDRVRFVLDGRIRELRAVDPTLTVLNYLREVERRRGTKEGCAEGDCGACTVVLGELADGGLRHRAVNACILFVPALDGKAADHGREPARGDGTLHPVQQAMVDCHGSQCGFCTPGFVMSLFALYATRGRRRPRATINDALAGNLCRCTGYRPIVDAAPSAPMPWRRPRRQPPRRDRGAAAARSRGARRWRWSTTAQPLLRAAHARRAGRAASSAIPRRICSPAAPMSACGSPSSIARLDTVDLCSAASPSLRRDRESPTTHLEIGAGPPMPTRCAALDARIIPISAS